MKARKKVSSGWLVAIGLLSVTTLCLVSWAQTTQRTDASPGLLLSDTFAGKQAGWMAFGSDGAIRLTSDAAHVKTGKPALAFDYKIAPNQIVAAVLPVETGSLARMTQLKFWLKTDSSTAVAIILSEKKPEGGNYHAIVWSPKDTWQQIELTPEDFAPSEGPNGPRDPDGKLDLDQIEGVGVIDLGEMFVDLSGKPECPSSSSKPRARTLFTLTIFRHSPNLRWPALPRPPQAWLSTTFTGRIWVGLR